MTSSDITLATPDQSVRRELARDALEQYRHWNEQSATHEAWPVVMARLASGLELVLGDAES